MRQKSIRRWLKRNEWKIAEGKQDYNKKFEKQLKFCIKMYKL